MSTLPLSPPLIAALVLPAPVERRIEALSLLAFPAEACGLLIGSREDAVVREAVGCRNLSPALDRFELDPVEHLRAEDAARADGLEVVGVWHSHPGGSARPSEVDRAAAHAGWSYVIAAVVRAGVDEVRAWRLVGGRFAEQEIAR